MPADGRIEGMPPRTLAFKPERASMFAESHRAGGVHAFSEVEFLGILLRPQRRQHALRRKRRFAQADANGIVDGVGNSGNGGSQRAFTALLGAKGALGINALHDEWLNFRRFD